jgi:uncharacterized protein with PIN domain
MDKQDRKAFKLNIKHERRYEEEMLMKAEAENKAKMQLGAHGSMNRNSAQPQLYHTINYLANFFVRFLPKAQCEVCCKPLVTAVKNDQSEMLPERGYCGHWLHKKCFIEYVEMPPFERTCPTYQCEEILACPEIPSDPVSVK